MKIGVMWRKNRNIEHQKLVTNDWLKDDSFDEASIHYEGLKEAGYDAAIIEWTNDPQKTYREIIKTKIDMVFNASSSAEIGFLETFHIPFSGSSLVTVESDKAFRKIIAAYYGVITPNFAVVNDANFMPKMELKFPLFVKPINGRGSGGIDDSNIVESEGALVNIVRKITEKVRQPALIEEYIKGRELTIGILGNGRLETLPILEIGYRFGKTNTYEHKMLDQEILTCPMVIEPEVEAVIVKAALTAYKELKIADFGRVDMILDENNIPYFLEVNTFPGLVMPGTKMNKTAHYGYMGHMAKQKGYSQADFLGRIVESTVERYPILAKKKLFAG
jgi:D-alanine-D-alanine ligase